MILLKKIFDFYINSSLHVSLAIASLVLMTYYFAKLPVDFIVLFFVFFGTIVSYNLIKYSLFVVENRNLKPSMKGIIALTFLSLFISVFLFFKLQIFGQITAVFFALLSLFYFIPIPKSKTNLRNLAGIKIYIVSFCWAGVSLLIPLLNADFLITNDIIYKFIQRFILVLILILIFEINDLKYDDVRLKTVPQSIGIINTKYLIYFLLLIFYVLEFFKTNQYSNQWIINLILVSAIFISTMHANDRKSKYYTLFWVESIPIFWCLLIWLFS